MAILHRNAYSLEARKRLLKEYELGKPSDVQLATKSLRCAMSKFIQ